MYPYSHNSNRQAPTWREKLAEIKAAREELNKYGHMMGEYNAMVISRDIQRKKEAAFKDIVDGALYEHEQALQRVLQARMGVTRAIAGEINKWDVDKLNREISLTQSRVKLAMDAGSDALTRRNGNDSLTAIYTEAKASGDPYKARAAAEVFQGILKHFSGGQEDRILANRVAEQAKSDLAAIRESEAVQAARKAEEETTQGYLAVRHELRQMSIDLGEGDCTGAFPVGPFAQAMRRMQRDRVTGELIIYGPRDPEVTGVSLMVEKSEESNE